MEKANFFWKGELTKVEIASIKSFINNGFDVNLWSYDNLIMEGASCKNANEVLEDIFIEQRHCELGNTKIAAFSDLMRYSILSKEEGWWFDLDCICLKSQSKFKELRENVGNNKILVGLYNCDGKILAASGVMYLNKEIATELKKKCINILEQYNYSLPEWGMIGPSLVHNYLIENNLLHHAVLPHYFYELSFREMDMFCDKKNFKTSMRRIKNSYITHVWDTFLVIDNIDKNNPPKDSLLDYLIKY